MADINSIYDQWKALLPLSEKKQAQLSRKFTVEYNYNSNHIEGNTLTYGQTELLLLFGKVSGEAEMKDFEEMKASNVGLKMMTEVANEKLPLTETFIRQLHYTLLRKDYTVHTTLPGGLPSSNVVHSGSYKTRPNSVITRYGDRFEYASPEETPALMNDLVNWYNEAENSGKYTPAELAALFHYRYIRIHPFEDGNGRIARLMVNYILSRHEWPMIVVRNRDKKAYLEALHHSDLIVGPTPSDGAHASLREIRHFLTYFKKLIINEIKANIDFVTKSAENVWWYDGQIVKFRSHNTSKILFALQENPAITYEELTKLIGINTSAIQKQINNLIKNGYIQRKNSDSEWYVLITSTI
ncbi:MAG: Fic family protein [Bacteroidales bacterium]|nr:Fic family protein [Bacteroidales bacterium]